MSAHEASGHPPAAAGRAARRSAFAERAAVAVNGSPVTCSARRSGRPCRAAMRRGVRGRRRRDRRERRRGPGRRAPRRRSRRARSRRGRAAARGTADGSTSPAPSRFAVSATASPSALTTARRGDRGRPSTAGSRSSRQGCRGGRRGRAGVSAAAQRRPRPASSPARLGVTAAQTGAGARRRSARRGRLGWHGHGRARAGVSAAAQRRRAAARPAVGVSAGMAMGGRVRASRRRLSGGSTRRLGSAWASRLAWPWAWACGRLGGGSAAARPAVGVSAGMAMGVRVRASRRRLGSAQRCAVRRAGAFGRSRSRDGPRRARPSPPGSPGAPTRAGATSATADGGTSPAPGSLAVSATAGGEPQRTPGVGRPRMSRAAAGSRVAGHGSSSAVMRSDGAGPAAIRGSPGGGGPMADSAEAASATAEPGSASGGTAQPVERDVPAPRFAGHVQCASIRAAVLAGRDPVGAEQRRAQHGGREHVAGAEPPRRLGHGVAERAHDSAPRGSGPASRWRAGSLTA